MSIVSKALRRMKRGEKISKPMTLLYLTIDKLIHPETMDIDDMRFYLVEYYQCNLPRGWETQLDSIEEALENAEQYVEQLSDEEVRDNYNKFINN